MTVVFVTGLSGVGKSTTLERLKEQGHKVVDTDYGYVTAVNKDGAEEKVLEEEKMARLLSENGDAHLYISGCYSNQGRFYKHFDYVVLLTAELNVMIKRIDERTNNSYGKTSLEKNEIIESFHHVLPLLKKGSDIIIDTTNIDVEDVCCQMNSLL